GACSPDRAPLQGRGRRRLGEIAPIRRDRGSNLCRERLWRGRRPALRGAGATARPRRSKTSRLSAAASPPIPLIGRYVFCLRLVRRSGGDLQSDATVLRENTN